MPGATCKPATLFHIFWHPESWVEFACSQLLDVHLKQDPRLAWSKRERLPPAPSKSLTWNSFISLLKHRFPLQFWPYHLIAQSPHFLISVLSGDNGVPLHPKGAGNWRLPIRLAEHTKTLFQDNWIFAYHRHCWLVQHLEGHSGRFFRSFSGLLSSKKKRNMST